MVLPGIRDATLMVTGAAGAELDDDELLSGPDPPAGDTLAAALDAAPFPAGAELLPAPAELAAEVAAELPDPPELELLELELLELELPEPAVLLQAASTAAPAIMATARGIRFIENLL